MSALGLEFYWDGASNLPVRTNLRLCPAERGPPHLFRTQNCEANRVSDVPPSICRVSLTSGQSYVVQHHRTCKVGA